LPYGQSESQICTGAGAGLKFQNSAGAGLKFYQNVGIYDEQEQVWSFIEQICGCNVEN
jgi:hypothetical protein